MSAGDRSRFEAGALLMHALAVDAAAAGCVVTPVSMVSRDWASATFTGAQHWIEIVVAGDGVAAWLSALPEAALPMRRHVLGDIVVDAVATGGDGHRVSLAALTLVDAR